MMTPLHHEHARYSQPLDYYASTEEPPSGTILDLCVRRNSNSSSMSVGTLSPPGSVTILQQQLLRPVQLAPTEEITLPLTTQVFSANGRNSKPTRPFKAYPKDPLSMAAGVATAEALLGQTSTEAYTEFRRRMLEQVQVAGGKIRTPTPTVKRPLSPQQPSSTDSTNGEAGRDAAYWERRRRNNEAAKRSRDARRAKEDEIAIRAAFLEQENLKLKYEVAALRSELSKMRCLIYNS